MNTQACYISTRQKGSEGPYDIEEIFSRFNTEKSQQDVVIWTGGWINWVSLNVFIREYQKSGKFDCTPDKVSVFHPYSFIEALRKFFSCYACFNGRATRSEYWYFQLIFISYFVLDLIEKYFIARSAISGFVVMLAISLIWWLVSFLPYLSVLVRRLHDIGLSGWWCLIYYIPLLMVNIFTICKVPINCNVSEFFGYLFLFIKLAFVIILGIPDSKRGMNKYGVSEKYPHS